MAITKQAIKLYWVTTSDHGEDWFIFSYSARQARSYHEDYEGYGKGDANSRLIVSNVTLKEFMNGTPPCHAQFQDLCQIGFKNAGSIPNRRRAGCNGEIFREGILEAIIELGRNQLVAENGCVQTGKSVLFNSDAQGGNRTAASALEAGLEGSARGCGGLFGERGDLNPERGASPNAPAGENNHRGRPPGGSPLGPGEPVFYRQPRGPDRGPAGVKRV